MTDPWRQWMKRRRWNPFPFQVETWDAYLANESGLIHAPTGLGKTYAVWGGPLLEWFAERRTDLPGRQGPRVFQPAGPVHRVGKPEAHDAHECPSSTAAEPLRVLWITPLRALANDTVESLRAPLRDLKIPWTVELRTGDTPTAARNRQRVRFPTALVTTPESLSLLLTHEDTREKMSHLRCVVVDEWHELLGSKRGVQTELCLARLRRWCPGLRVWGLSATLGNMEEALNVLVPDSNTKRRLVTSREGQREIILKTILPRHIERFPWSGHIGLNLLPAVIRRIEARRTTLLFTNTRSQTEIWHQALLAAPPDWSRDIALHHGSIDRSVREEVESRLRAGTVKCVVCTSSLDLGVDFSPVEQVIQVGGPKGIARMLQRAGRSGHRPGAASRIHCVPAHALELVEFAAVRDGIKSGDMESREPMDRPLDVLVQHLVTLGIGGGFQGAETLAEVRSTHAFRLLSDDEWHWTLDFITKGGRALGAYPQFQRVRQDDGNFSVPDPLIAKFHRMSIGTITSDATMLVKLRHGGSLGSIEEGFIARLRPGDGFFFAGRALELVRTHEMTAVVRPAKKVTRRIPQWLGGKMPLSSQLALAVRRKLAEARQGNFSGPEMKAVAPVLRLQAAWSLIPNPDELLVEHSVSREGFHYFVYPFAGRLAHEGLAALVAHRLGRSAPRTFALTMNDYGFALSTTVPLELDESAWRRVLSPDRLLEDLLDCLNGTELARRQFREIARVAGLVFQGYPGTRKSMRQLQASSGLFFDVFARYDPDNLLLQQSRREVLERQLEVRRLRLALENTQASRFVLRETKHLTPLAFPLWAMWLQGEVTSESWSERVKRMVSELEAAAARDDDSGDAPGKRKRGSRNRVGG